MNDAGLNCFLENRNLFSNAKTTPEKFNLYNGLTFLSKAVSDLSLKIEEMGKEIEDLKYKLRKRDLID